MVYKAFKTCVLVALMLTTRFALAETGPIAKCQGQDMSKNLNLTCDFAYQGITADGTAYEEAFDVEWTCNDYYTFPKGASISVRNSQFKAHFTVVNGRAVMSLLPIGGKRTSLRMDVVSLNKKVTQQVQLPEEFRTSGRDLVQDIAFSCQVQSPAPENANPYRFK